ncbi:hypothetical protein LTR17_021079 [Elasticomyces elasticus]|nr:hypothetical protein LTR17_021079 [Elasticomyces elasticus]
MADSNQIKNIAIVGASGQVGSSVLKHLLESPKGFNITVITRTDSQATFPSSVTVKKGTYDDTKFMEDAFKGQDAAIFALHYSAQAAQDSMLDAAAKAGVKWLIPNEYAGDGMNEAMMKAAPAFAPKLQSRKHIEELSKTYEGVKWIGVTTNPFFESFLVASSKIFGIDVAAHTATIYPDAGRFNTSTLDRIGLSMTRMLSLPISDSSNPRASLQHYANNFLYTSSYCVTQTELLQAIQKAKGESEADWTVNKDKTVKESIEQSEAAMKEGNFQAGFALVVYRYIGEGLGGNYEDKAQEDRKALGLEAEQDSFEAAVKRVLKAGGE